MIARNGEWSVIYFLPEEGVMAFPLIMRDNSLSLCSSKAMASLQDRNQASFCGGTRVLNQLLGKKYIELRFMDMISGDS